MKNENKELCSECGGYCCKKSGCDYYVSDFKRIDKNTILEALASKKISIVSAFVFERLNDDKIVATPFLYLRARNQDRDIVDLYSVKTTCMSLTETGCAYTYENRPGGGKNLIPQKPICKPLLDPIEQIKAWAPYQGLLSKIVKRITGNSVNTIIKENVKEMFVRVLNQDFDDVNKDEIKDIRDGIPVLIRCFPEEYKEAKIQHELHSKVYCKTQD